MGHINQTLKLAKLLLVTAILTIAAWGMLLYQTIEINHLKDDDNGSLNFDQVQTQFDKNITSKVLDK